MSKQGSGGNVLAAICSFFIPGLGQLVQGRIMAALLFCVITYGFYFTWILALIGLLIHLWAIVDAARYSNYASG